MKNVTRKSKVKKVDYSSFKEKDQKDLEILAKIKSGEVNAYEYFYDKYYQYIQYHCYLSVKNLQVADDLTMEILTKIYLSLDKYSVNHTFNAWVWRIIRNHVVDYIRKSKNEPINRNVNSVIQSFESNDSDINVSSVDLSTGELNPQETLEANNTSKIRKAFVSNLLNSMSEKERMILIHYYYDEMSYDEIAAKLNIGLSAMKVTLMRAKEKLKNRIGSIDKVSHLFAQ